MDTTKMHNFKIRDKRRFKLGQGQALSIKVKIRTSKANTNMHCRKWKIQGNITYIVEMHVL